MAWYIASVGSKLCIVIGVCSRLGVNGRRSRIRRICGEISVSSNTADYILTLQCRWTGYLAIPALVYTVSLISFVVA